MRKVLPFIFACIIGIGVSNAAVRNTSTVSRNNTSAQTVSSARTTRQNNVISRTTSPQVTTSRIGSGTTRSTTSRTNPTNASRATTRQVTNTGRSRNGGTTISRAAVSTVSRVANESKTFGTGYNTCRDAYFTCMDQFCASADDTYRRCICSARLAEIKTKQRALTQSADQLQDFKDLNIEAIPKTAAEVKAMQNASDGELVASYIRDKSESIAQLAGISAVLTNTKSKSLSTAGQLDIAGDINAIWATTDLASGLNISNLTGETLYSAVHSQCVNLVADRCSSKSLLNMVVSAYSMYIENDCSLLATSLNKQKNSANATIRETEREMNAARLENYDAHNSSSINDCIAMVRQDVTSDSACGKDYVHCLDVSGLYLNRTTGEPIYTSNFYRLGSTLSLSGDILTNQTNRFLVTELNRKRIFAEKSLDTCRDLADEVWDEFMRQAITEIYQGQQTRIRDVKNECLDVVNKCYDAQNNALKDFSNIKEQLLLGARLELSEQLCREKLDACSNLYGGGPNGMAELLTTMFDITTQQISQNCFTTLQEYAKQLCAVPTTDSLHSYPYSCRAYAPGEQQYAMQWTCNQDTSSATTDSSSTSARTAVTHRVMATKFAIKTRAADNVQDEIVMIDDEEFTPADEDNPTPDNDDEPTPGNENNSESPIEEDPVDEPIPIVNTSDLYVCPAKKYISCNFGYYMENPNGDVIDRDQYAAKAMVGNRCVKCPAAGCPTSTGGYTPVCGTDYNGSLYQKLVRYAIQACMRPSVITEIQSSDDPTVLWQKYSTTILQDVNATMGLIKVAMASSLKAECERLGGHWITTQWTDSSTDSGEPQITLFAQFYNETSANTKWGYCADPASVTLYYTGENPDTSEETTGN